MLDRLGIICSTACAAHCALPIVIGLMSPSLSAFFGNEWIHFGLLIIVIPLAIFSFLHSKKRHNQNSPLVFGILGGLLLISAVFAEHNFEIGNFELLATISGSFILILGHFLNLKFMRCSSLTN